MAINFTDSPSNGATQTISGRTYTYNSAKNKWDTTATEVTGPTATVYASVDNLPTSGNITGSQAFVSGTNRLYIWNGSGWYNIALINNTPTISGANSSYALANDGTATTVTLVATDPEGLPITYSIASDTSGSTATVTQGTGSNTNVFTITPSTNSAHAGTFSLTFRASDGVNLATAVSSFTLQFQVQNQNYTQALITSVGANNAVNNSFDDKSTNDHTITVVGDTNHCGMSPYRPGGYSTYFDGTGDYLKVTDSAEHDFGTGDFSMEFFWWPVTVTGNSGNIHIMISAPNNSHNQFIYHESNYWYYQVGGGGATVIPSSTGAATAKTWNHVVLCRSGTTMSIFSNGTRTATVQSSAAVDFSHATIGRYDSGGYEVDGYVRDMRWLKGSSAYDATQTSITVPTEPLSAITNTTLLTCHLPYIADGSTTGHSIAVNGDTHTLPFVPYDDVEYSNATHLGSVHFDGSGDYLHMPQTSLDLGSDDFCVEAWVYTYSTANQAIIGSYRYADGVGSWNLNINYNSKKLRFFIRHSGGTVIDGQFESGTFPKRQWTHVAVTRDGANLRAFINGKQAGSTNTSLGSSSIDNAITTYRVGIANDNNIPWTGNFTDVRVVKGSSVYTSNFTPPTSALSTITNTILHLPMADGGIIDKAQTTNNLKIYGNAKSSTTQTKYLTSSIYLDGTGDYIDIAPAFSQFFDFGTLPFTIEFWMHLTNISGEKIILESRAGHSDAGFLIMLNSGVMKNLTSNAVRTTGGTTIAADTWYHVAVVRDSTSLRTYLNGTEESGSASYTSAVTAPFSKFRLGARFDGANTAAGYFSDVRITKGLARYTSNFTAPTAALAG